MNIRRSACLVVGLSLLVSSPASKADVNPDEITVYMPKFDGAGALSQNAATVLSLQVWSTLRRMPWPNNPEKLDFGPARIVWDPDILPEPSHDAAESRARDNRLLAQIVIWGRAYSVRRWHCGSVEHDAAQV